MDIKKKIELITPLSIGPEPLAMLALALLDEIPAVEIALYTHNSIGPYGLVTVLGSIGMAAYQTRNTENPNKNKNYVATICASNQPADASLLQHLVETSDRSPQGMSKSFHVAFGMLMGYPLSAIEGFINDQPLPERDLFDQDSLLVFVLSKNNYREEIKTVTRWRKALEKNAPKILERLDSTVAIP